MSQKKTDPDRFVGLDVHKHYLIAAAVDLDRNEVMSPRRVPLARLDPWVRKTLHPRDAVVLEMTANAFQLYDDLLPCVHSVTVVHPPHVALITRAQVRTEKIAARTLAKLHTYVRQQLDRLGLGTELTAISFPLCASHLPKYWKYLREF